jgi:hypothetical protein
MVFDQTQFVNGQKKENKKYGVPRFWVLISFFFGNMLC